MALTAAQEALYEQVKRERRTRAIAKSSLSATEVEQVVAATERMRKAGYTLCQHRSYFDFWGKLHAFSYESSSAHYGHCQHEFVI